MAAKGWGLDSCARSDGCRFDADCGDTFARGERSRLGSWGLDSLYQCDGRKFDDFTQERALSAQGRRGHQRRNVRPGLLGSRLKLSG